ncbi:deoxyribodipyrimidine photo-lyase [Neisseria sp. Ec49-e6-T10]|uniref:deoxyribodipyrimidine photo-lyase n=1 Tax=Neisseria sp. Ec49-e6-T10 TaxID=3140744 RepID=UPI003EB76467
MQLKEERIHHLNQHPINKQGDYILYWMQASVRTYHNQALTYAIKLSNDLKKPLIVAFVYDSNYPMAQKAHFQFLFDGLHDVKQELHTQNIRFILLSGTLNQAILSVINNCCCLITDLGYTHFLRQSKDEIANKINISAIGIEANIIVPVQTAYPKAAYSAAVIRPKLMAKLEDFLFEQTDCSYKGIFYTKTIEQEIPFPFKHQHIGGQQQAIKKLRFFIENQLANYAINRNFPELDATSRLSAYLHFGQISPILIYRQIMENHPSITTQNKHVFIDELFIRRELAINFTYYEHDYDNLSCLPIWAQKSLEQHQYDHRAITYTPEIFEQAKTFDPYWNAAQQQLTKTGYMHNYMRMYWGKKIIEWSQTYQEALQTMLYLNDTYQLDGRDPNGYAGIMWCFGKHDRPWFEREIFGKIRYMNASGLRRKFNIDQYVCAINQL